MFSPRDRPGPGPAYMSRDQQASYLATLRTPTVSRPTGSRPAPPSRFSGLKRSDTEISVVPHQAERPSLPTSNSMPTMLHQRSRSSIPARADTAGRSIVQPPSTAPSEMSSEPPGHAVPTVDMPYMERGTRWMEKQEVRSVRMALEDMDLEEEKRLHATAQDEAAELVWKHRNPIAAQTVADAPFANPDIPRDYHQHLRKGSYQRSHSREAMHLVERRSASGSSQESENNEDGQERQQQSFGSISSVKRRSVEVLRKISPPTAIIPIGKKRTPSGKSYGGLAEAVASDIAQAHRRVSSGSRKRILSGEKKMFMHPDDKIYEDPLEEQSPQPRQTRKDPTSVTATTSQVPAHIRKNPFARVRLQAEKLERSNSEPILTGPSRPSSIEIQRNPPSQSRRPWYMSNEPLPPTPPGARERDADEVSPKVTPTKEGKELRGDDIRAATSKQRKDYSPKLPRPTVVSDKPGRPIVSFKQDWRPKEVVLEEVTSPGRAPKPNLMPVRSQTEPQWSSTPRVQVGSAQSPSPGIPIPILIVPDEPCIPSIVLPEEPEFAEPLDVQSAPVTPMIPELPSIFVDPPSICVEPPSINISAPEVPLGAPARASRPEQIQAPARPLPHHAATSPLPKSTPHYTPSTRQSGTLCAHCALPIAGRILSAAGERFHPSCFVCHQCHTNLELVAFYPEPENKRTDRIDRITARQSGVEVIPPSGTTPEEAYDLEYQDGDPSSRFYCHLDFHELFSPRCKSCKTPIEGEVIVACGAEWHAGHFFCAQCGDPFDSTTPFVEKDGYAWCVGCHTNRFSSKCRKCKKPVIDTVVKALGHDWHGQCFVCTECHGEFQDGRYFLRGLNEDPVCVGCEERRLKA